MSNTAIRGAEISARIVVAGQMKGGTFLRLKNATITQNVEHVRDDYIGEAQAEIDSIHDGWQVEMEFDEDDDAGIRYAQQVAVADENHQRPLLSTITIMTVYRNGTTRPIAETFPDSILLPKTRTIGGRKERVPNAFIAMSKTRDLVTL